MIMGWRSLSFDLTLENKVRIYVFDNNSKSKTHVTMS